MTLAALRALVRETRRRFLSYFDLTNIFTLIGNGKDIPAAASFAVHYVIQVPWHGAENYMLNKCRISQVSARS